VPPAGRPDPDTARNITKALSLDPDAIIINLPSNDAGSGVSAAQQMANFREMVDSAAVQGVPVWVCTTQPRVFSSANVAVQLAVRDSILAAFGSRALDFWTGIADSMGWPLAIYDSGDGVHLNDLGHRLLWQRALAAQVPDSSLQVPDFPDYQPLSLASEALCGVQQTPLRLHWGNLGQADSLPVLLDILATSDGLSVTYRDTLPPLGTCQLDEWPLRLNLSGGNDWQLSLRLTGAADSLAANDSLHQRLRVLGTTAPLGVDDAVCIGDSATLVALSANQEQLYWYAEATDSLPIWDQSSLPLPPLFRDTTLWVAAKTGLITRSDSLATPAVSDRDWNGIMIDLIAQVDLTVDTVFLPINHTGSQVLRLYTRPGSYLGKENAPLDWQLQDTVAFMVSSIAGRQALPVQLGLTAGDTIGLYLHLADPTSRMRYQAVSTTQQFANDDLTLITGTGVSHTFGATYYPRQIHAALAYHYELGPCESDRVPVRAQVVEPRFSLGPDTLLYPGDTLSLAGPVADRYQWSTGDSTASISLVIGATAPDTLYVWLTTEVSPGCVASDTVAIVVASIPSHTPAPPTPRAIQAWVDARQQLVIQGLTQRPEWVELIDLTGRRISQWAGQVPGTAYPLPAISRGYYWLRITGAEGPYPVIAIQLGAE
jgi:hypothetical protein